MKRVAIIGGGASGLVAASFISQKYEVLLFEKRSSCGKKILVTGNGRCNYWNANQELKNYHSSHLEILDKINTLENREKVLDLFDRLGIIPYIKNGYYYPYSREASTIRNALLEELERRNVKIINDFTVNNIVKRNDKFMINEDKDNIEVDKVILATGSLAYYKDDDSNIGYRIAASFGHNIVDVLPSLVQLKTNYGFTKDWKGVRADATVSLLEDGKVVKTETGEILLTDYGISGICVFNISGIAARSIASNHKVSVSINFVPWYKEDDFLSWLEQRDKIVNNLTILEFIEGFLNSKLAKVILHLAGIKNEEYWKDLDDNKKNALVGLIKDFKLEIKGTNSYDSAQVCSGGVSLDEINPNTMESLKEKGLYIVGELLDVDGDCGGYNLSFAFLSGMLAGWGIEEDD